jgi:SAM-dependent methyltransferase
MVSVSDFYSKTSMGNPCNPLVKTQIPQLEKYLKSLDNREKEIFTILDIGCGDGSYVTQLVEGVGLNKIRVVEIYGLDISAKAISCFNANSGYRGTVGAAEKLPHPNGKFDLVLLNDVIEHVVDTDGVMAEIKRVMAPEGLCLLSTPNLSAWFNRILLILGIQPIYTEVSFKKIYGRPGTEIVGHLRLFTYKAAIQFILDQDTRNIECKFSRFDSLPFISRFISNFFCKFTNAGDCMSFSFNFKKPA